MKKLLFLLPLIACFACRQKVTDKTKPRDRLYNKAEAFLDKQQNDSAFYYFNKVVTNSKDSLQVAMAYNDMAVIQSDAGDYFGSQETLLTSLKFLNQQKDESRTCLASDYNELGLTSIKLKNYRPALDYFDQALNYSADKRFRLAILNNKALAYLEKGEYPQSLKIYRQVLPQTTRKQTYARILTNMARAEWLANPGYNAAPQMLKALAIRRQEKDDWGLNSSYMHLQEFYAAKRPDSALFYAKAMYRIASQLKSPDDQLDALDKLIRVSAQNEVKPYFMKYRKLNDSLQTTRNAAKNQFALTRYNAEKAKADNLKLQKENTDRKYQLVKQHILLYTIIVLTILTALFFAHWYRKRKQTMALETQQKIRENLLKTSKKVHDVVANGLYRMMTEIDNTTNFDKEKLVDKLDELYEKSRDISYENDQTPNQSFHREISALLTSFSTEDVKILVAGNEPILWLKMTDNARPEIEHMLQELMVNMAKHSQATTVAIRFEQHKKDLQIHYTDNGVGMTAGTIFKNGLNNTVSRIEGLNGSFTFDTEVKHGLKVQVTLPVLKD